jgi:hypothetical protein
MWLRSIPSCQVRVFGFSDRSASPRREVFGDGDPVVHVDVRAGGAVRSDLRVVVLRVAFEAEPPMQVLAVHPQPPVVEAVALFLDAHRAPALAVRARDASRASRSNLATSPA